MVEMNRREQDSARVSCALAGPAVVCRRPRPVVLLILECPLLSFVLHWIWAYSFFLLQRLYLTSEPKPEAKANGRGRPTAGAAADAEPWTGSTESAAAADGWWHPTREPPTPTTRGGTFAFAGY